jgi:hypothetical protein
MLKRILCFLGFHNWVFKSSRDADIHTGELWGISEVVEQCLRCSKERFRYSPPILRWW